MVAVKSFKEELAEMQAPPHGHNSQPSPLPLHRLSLIWQADKDAGGAEERVRIEAEAEERRRQQELLEAEEVAPQ